MRLQQVWDARRRPSVASSDRPTRISSRSTIVAARPGSLRETPEPGRAESTAIAAPDVRCLVFGQGRCSRLDRREQQIPTESHVSFVRPTPGRINGQNRGVRVTCRCRCPIAVGAAVACRTPSVHRDEGIRAGCSDRCCDCRRLDRVESMPILRHVATCAASSSSMRHCTCGRQPRCIYPGWVVGGASMPSRRECEGPSYDRDHP